MMAFDHTELDNLKTTVTLRRRCQFYVQNNSPAKAPEGAGKGE